VQPYVSPRFGYQLARLFANSAHAHNGRETTPIKSMALTARRSRNVLAILLVAAPMLGIGGAAQAARSADPELVALVPGKFSDLTTAELALLKFVGSDSSDPEGFAVAGPSANPDDPTNNPAYADHWGRGREVRAELIEWLCVDQNAKRLVPRGIRLLGARITGKLNLAHVISRAGSDLSSRRSLAHVSVGRRQRLARRPQRQVLQRADGSRELLPSKCDRVKVQKGDLLHFQTWGGGGWGDPLERPSALVAADVDRGLVTCEGAKRYGVVLDENLRVDVKATQALREEIARTRGPHRMFDFRGSIEELKARCKAETGFDPPVSPTFATWVRSRQQKLARLQDVKR
jgi:hypothetical protein